MLAVLLAAAVAIAKYDCTVDPGSSAVRVLGTVAKTDPLTFENMPAGGWQFTVTFNSSNPPRADLWWPEEPIQAQGTYPAYITGKGSFAFVAIRGGPCMFTDGSCLSLIHVVDESDTKAFVSVAAAGLSTTESGEKNVPFVPVIHGVCTRKVDA